MCSSPSDENQISVKVLPLSSEEIVTPYHRRLVTRLSFLKRCYPGSLAAVSTLIVDANTSLSCSSTRSDFVLSLRRMLSVQHEELLLAGDEETKKGAQQRTTQDGYFRLLIEESLIGSCLDPHALVYQWVGGKNRMILPWEENGNVTTQEEKDDDANDDEEVEETSAATGTRESDYGDDCDCSSSSSSIVKDNNNKADGLLKDDWEDDGEDEDNSTFELIHYGEHQQYQQQASLSSEGADGSFVTLFF